MNKRTVRLAFRAGLSVMAGYVVTGLGFGVSARNQGAVPVLLKKTTKITSGSSPERFPLAEQKRLCSRTTSQFVKKVFLTNCVRIFRP